jgi:S-adenosylmethionine synthetase
VVVFETYIYNKNMVEDYYFTSESVSEGHPDKLADQISDGILDAILKQDKNSRVACETLVKTGTVIIAGEITSKAYVDISKIARNIILNIGYNSHDTGFDGNSCGILTLIDEQSPDISMGVTESPDREQGAGDQGTVFGYACDETKDLMPATINYAHKILKKLSDLRKNNFDFLLPDAKSQVTAKYQNGKLSYIDTIVVSSQHRPEINISKLKEFIIEECIKKVIPTNILKNVRYLINPTGRFVLGGPIADCGLTGRKIIVDTYGGHGSHGGGAFSGKDPTKVDRSGAYMARYIAKNIVGAKLAKKCLVQLSYAIGVAEPVSVFVNTFGTSKYSSIEITKKIKNIFTLKPKDIINHLDLLRPIYLQTAAYGHFGRNIFPWEKLDLIDKLNF